MAEAGVQAVAVSIGNGGLFVNFILIIPALQLCFTGNTVAATAAAKTAVRFPLKINFKKWMRHFSHI